MNRRDGSRLRAGGRVDRRPLLVSAGLLVVGAILTWFAATHFAYAAGMAGTPGHLRVASCSWTRAGGHRYPHCHGTFHSTDGAVVDRGATIGTKLRVGSTVTLRRTSHGTYEQPGLPASCGWLALTQLGLLTGLLALLAACNRQGTRRTPRPLRLVIGTLATMTLVSALVGGVVGVAGSF
ncbi:hypothetical protein [Streptomyces sp. NPDC048643]|uniref:hypothetical protein n=1 Tax=Streptomyces sp. NPDC048643 TaxID=3155637 RepID=UPI003445121D